MALGSAAAHLLLAVTSAWALSKSNHFIYASFAFMLYLINGVIGTIAYGLDGVNLVSEADRTRLKRTSVALWFWGYVFGMPLLVAEMFLQSGYHFSWSFIEFACPINVFFSLYILTPETSAQLLEASHAATIVALSYLTFIRKKFCGHAIASIYAIAFFHSTVDDLSEFTIKWPLLLSVANILSVWAIKDFRVCIPSKKH